ncbi:GGDEF domain-containing protein [Pseudonocardia phyllosphaerae]|uniref:GGDEF domain-containing protein n=1 Tax=Pseudonocardia phyllosphaerae TaxID=3390502 RepID=UPI00397E44D3
MSRWQLWRAPAAVIALSLLVDAAAVGVIVGDFTQLALPPHRTVFTGVFLAVAGVLHTEMVSGVERLRRYAMETHHVNLTSVWTLAGALLLPPALATLVVLVIYAHLYLRVQRAIPAPDRRPLNRTLYNAATIVLAVEAAALVTATARPGGPLAGTSELVTTALAILAFTAVNAGLVMTAVRLVDPQARPLHILFRTDALTLELATLCLGALTAGALALLGPIISLLAVPPILALHRTILVRELRRRADTDAKTGLLNHSAWRRRSAHALRVAEQEGRPAALLLLDLDHFKAVNDTYGHLTGDQVLATIAGALRAELRDHDLIGRFGGEEFVVLLPHLHPGDGREETWHIAERLRRRVARSAVVAPHDTVCPRGAAAPADGPAGPDGTTTGSTATGSAATGSAAGPDDAPRPGIAVTVSIGGAVFPADAGALTALLEIADGALYAAKHSGRDTVRIGAQPARSRNDTDAGVVEDLPAE